MEDTIVYRVALIGGPFDAAPGLHVVAWSEMPPPDRLRVGMCSGRGECQFSPCAGKRHVAYWIPEVEDAPVRAEPYELEEHDEIDAADPVARYVVGGLSMPRRGEQVEMVPAGAAGGVAYGCAAGVIVFGRVAEELGDGRVRVELTDCYYRR